MKFALFFILSLVALQGFQARSVEDVHSVEPLANGSLRNILDDILEFISRIVEIINNVTAQITEIIGSITSRIREIVERIQQIIQGINDAIGDLITQGEIARQCVEAEREQIDALVNFANEGAQRCVRQAQAETDNLQDQLRVLLQRAEALRVDVVNRVTRCLEESRNPIVIIRCLRAQVGPIGEQIDALQNEIEDTIRVARETAVNVVNALVECSAELQEQIAARQEQLLTDIRQCIEANQPPQEV